MNVLLDTHVWLWGLLEPERIGGAAREVLDEPGCAPHLSPISAWEALVLARKGRLIPEGDAAEWIREALRQSSATMLPITHAIAIRSETIPGPALTDPADRFLAATAIEHELTLLTADAALIALDALSTIPAR